MTSWRHKGWKTALLCATALAGMAPAAAMAADRANTVVIGEAGQVNTLDPIHADYNQVNNIVAYLYSPLVTYDTDFNIIGSLASEFQIADDAKSISFTLRDAVFHDGTPVTAKDVAYTFERVKRLGTGAATFIELYDSTTVVDDKHVVIHISAPSTLFLTALSKIFILNSTLLSANAGADDGQVWLQTNDAGSGPYTLKSYSAAEVAMEWFDGYWLPQGDRPAGINLRRIDESATKRNELVAGNIDVGLSMSQRDTYALADTPGLAVASGPYPAIVGVFFNTTTGPTADPRVRKAIRLAYDYEGALKGIHSGHGALPNGPLPDSLACRPDLPVVARDTEEAKKLLAEAGQSNLTLTMNFQPVFEEQVQEATLLQSNLKEIGVTLNLEPIAFPNYLEKLKDPAQIPQMMLLSDYAAFPDPGAMLDKTYLSDAIGTNRSGYANPDVDKLLNEALVNPDADRRCDLYKQAQVIIDADSVFMPMYLPGYSMPYRADFLKNPLEGAVQGNFAPLDYALKK